MMSSISTRFHSYDSHFNIFLFLIGIYEKKKKFIANLYYEEQEKQLIHRNNINIKKKKIIKRSIGKIDIPVFIGTIGPWPSQEFHPQNFAPYICFPISEANGSKILHNISSHHI